MSIARLAPGSRILEIGAGTGQLTLPLAARGFEILALEPGPALAAILRRKVAPYPAVTSVERTFESWTLDARPFDLVVSARAFHWLAPDIRFGKSADALVAGGALAVIGTAPAVHDTPLDRAIQQVYADVAPSLVERGAAVRRELEDELIRSGRFEVSPAREYRQIYRYSITEYLDLLQTHSSHRLLAAARRAALLDGIGRAIAAHGGSFDVEYVDSLIIGFARSGVVASGHSS